jgi:hypothetical protein
MPLTAERQRVNAQAPLNVLPTYEFNLKLAKLA